MPHSVDAWQHGNKKRFVYKIEWGGAKGACKELTSFACTWHVALWQEWNGVVGDRA